MRKKRPTRKRRVNRGWPHAQGWSKYGAKRTTVDGINFASKRESKRYLELKALEKAGAISDLRLQVRYPLHVNGIKLGSYVADFVYANSDGEQIVDDSKGFPTPIYKWKKKHMAAEYGIHIAES